MTADNYQQIRISCRQWEPLRIVSLLLAQGTLMLREMLPRVLPLSQKPQYGIPWL